MEDLKKQIEIVFDRYKEKYKKYMSADASVSERTYYSNQTAYLALEDVQNEIMKLFKQK